MSCPPPDAVFQALVDGEPGALAPHLAGCEKCRSTWALGEAIARTPFPMADTERSVAKLMQKIKSDQPTARSRLWPVLALAAALLVSAPLFLLARPDTELQPRGGSLNQLSKSVGVTFRSLAEVERPLAPGDQLPLTTRLLMTHRNASQTTAYALVFAVDAAQNVHWLYPAHRREDSNEASIALGFTAADTPQSESVELDAPASGPLTLFALVTAEPRRVLEVERLGRVSPARLEAQFPGALVISVPVTLR